MYAMDDGRPPGMLYAGSRVRGIGRGEGSREAVRGGLRHASFTPCHGTPWERVESFFTNATTTYYYIIIKSLCDCAPEALNVLGGL